MIRVKALVGHVFVTAMMVAIMVPSLAHASSAGDRILNKGLAGGLAGGAIVLFFSITVLCFRFVRRLIDENKDAALAHLGKAMEVGKDTVRASKNAVTKTAGEFSQQRKYSSLEKRLGAIRQLKEARDEGLITEQEFDFEKSRLLDQE